MYIQKSDRNKIIEDNLSNLESKDIELLINLVFISSLMIKDKSDRSEEITKILNLSDTIGTDLDKRLQLDTYAGEDIKAGSKKIYNIDKLIDNDIIGSINPQDILDMVVEFTGNIEFFDMQLELEALLTDYRNDLSLHGYSDCKIMQYKTNDFYYQYASSSRTRAEIFANLAYLFNKLAHIFEDVQNRNNSFPISKETLDLKETFMRAKVFSVHEVIDEKVKGEDVKISVSQDKRNLSESKYSEYIFIALPHYLQPILLHMPDGELSNEEKSKCVDTDYFSSDIMSGTENSAIFPLKLTTEKEKALSYLYNNVYRNMVGRRPKFVSKLCWFFEENVPKKVIKGISCEEEIAKSDKLYCKKSKAIDINRENKIFLEKIFTDLEIELPEYMETHFLNRSNYSFQSFFEKIKTVIKRENDGMEPEELENIAEKVFIDMKITKPMSTLKLKGVDREELISAINESMQNSSRMFQFIKEQAGQFQGYPEFKSSYVMERNQQKSINNDLDEQSTKQSTSNDGYASVRKEILILLQDLHNIDQQVSTLGEELKILTTKKKIIEGELKKIREQAEKIADITKEN